MSEMYRCRHCYKDNFCGTVCSCRGDQSEEGAKAILTIARLEADKARLMEALNGVLNAFNGCMCQCDPDGEWFKARMLLAEMEK